MRKEDFEEVRRALKGVGRDLLDYMYDAPDNVLAEWLKAPFERAAASGDIPLTVTLMKAGASGNALGPAVTGGHRRLVRDLLERGKSYTDKNKYGETSLHLAAKFGHGCIVRTLLIGGADMDAVDKLGTPLHLSCVKGDVVGMQALIGHSWVRLDPPPRIDESLPARRGRVHWPGWYLDKIAPEGGGRQRSWRTRSDGSSHGRGTRPRRGDPNPSEGDRRSNQLQRRRRKDAPSPSSLPR